MAAAKNTYRVYAKTTLQATLCATVTANNPDDARDKAMLDFHQGMLTFPFESHGPVNRLKVDQMVDVPQVVDTRPG